MNDPPEKPTGYGLPTITPEGEKDPPPNGERYLMDPDHPLPKGYGYIVYRRADGTYVDDWMEIGQKEKPKAKWVGKTFTGTWAPGEERFGGRRKRSTRLAKKKRNGVSRRTRRRV